MKGSNRADIAGRQYGMATQPIAGPSFVAYEELPRQFHPLPRSHHQNRRSAW